MGCIFPSTDMVSRRQGSYDDWYSLCLCLFFLFPPQMNSDDKVSCDLYPSFVFERVKHYVRIRGTGELCVGGLKSLLSSKW